MAHSQNRRRQRDNRPAGHSVRLAVLFGVLLLNRSHRVVLANAAPELSHVVMDNATATLEEGTIQLDAPLFPLAPLLISLLAGEIRSTLLPQDRLVQRLRERKERQAKRR